MHSTLRRSPHREWGRELPGMSWWSVLRPLGLSVVLSSALKWRRRSHDLRNLIRWRCRGVSSDQDRQVGVVLPNGVAHR